MTYLDHAATTPMRPVVREVMEPFYSELFANPSGSHRFARQARKAVDDAREVVADLIGVRPGEVVFTSGGTESDNMVINGCSGGPGTTVCGAAEHHAVLHPIEARGGRIVGATATAHVDLEQLASALSADTALVSVMAVNNEVGTITDLESVATVVRRHAPNAVLHSDVVQAAAWLDLRPIAELVDSMSLSGHKLGGPKGVGVLTLASGIKLSPLLTGGGQERELRPGTHNVAGIVGIAAALQETVAQLPEFTVRSAALRDRLVESIRDRVPGSVETIAPEQKVAGAAHMCFTGIESETLLFTLDRHELYASAASACASGAMEPSHVLAAMGVDPTLARGALRMTLGWSTTPDDIDRAIDIVSESVTSLRSMYAELN